MTTTIPSSLFRIALILQFIMYPASSFLLPRPKSLCLKQTSRPINIATSHLSRPTPVNPPITHRRTSTTLPSFFGLGPAELALIAIAGVFVLGPSKLAQMTREAGNLAANSGGLGEEWKQIPEEFKKGVEEGEIEARGRRAKVMDDVGEEGE
jgi:Sec-independent protein translocase protein TatA